MTKFSAGAVLAVVVVLSIAAGSVAGQAVKPETAAVVGGQAISLAEVDQAVGAALLHARQSEYDLRASALKGLIYERLVTAEAAKQKITTEELEKREIIDRAGAPAEDDIKQTLAQYRSQLPPDETEARRLVVEALVNRKVAERREVYRKQLVAGAKVTIGLAPPRFPASIAPHSPSLGPVNAPVTIIEYSDFQCPYCATGRKTLDAVKKTYGDKVRIAFRNLPLDMHKEARFAAQAGLCASEQGGFWPLHDWMFENPTALARDKVVAKAGELTMDVDKFTVCLDDSRTLRSVEEDLAAAAALGVRATPAFFVNGRLLPGAMPYETFVEVIDEELASAAALAVTAK